MRKATGYAIASASGGAGYSDTLINFPCRVVGVLIETDGLNDPTVTFRDSSTATGDAFLPATSYDSAAKGLNGVVNLDIPILTSVHIVIVCAGAAKAWVYYL